jgi:hypothetical protein
MLSLERLVVGPQWALQQHREREVVHIARVRTDASCLGDEVRCSFVWHCRYLSLEYVQESLEFIVSALGFLE